ncbi:NAD(P)/FAD-dependent oxidoreductase [Eubacterium aggregans]|uniref:NAD(P)/FAD-dependent oxidoreductase n=1 Tax=Eubacterium aggregans TaxID=81409 RepID=UPI0023F181CF|nr:NAD(P)/FAD-dependent oxidoreductase [Eubacterium aggregans]MDD4691916.1 NAD(P)/FAD-dependent oxidoreductase [Eubacterium aggregans]
MERVMQTIVVGGGPAGMLAALSAAEGGRAVVLCEQNEKLGKKLYITGKGRCNVTNACDQDDFFENIMTNPRFLYSAFAAFNNYDLMGVLEDAGCPLQVERGNRVFPTSNKSSDIIRALDTALKRAGVQVRLGTSVKAIERETVEGKPKVIGVTLQDGSLIPGDRVILATGGMSYTSTGSDGYGMRLAKALGHRMVPCRPSLVGLTTKERWPMALQGLSLRNAGLTLYSGKKLIAREQGEMLFTHFGVSGPMVLSHSARIKKDPGNYRLSIDLKPGLSEEQIQARVVRDFEKYQNKQLMNAMGDLLPSKLIPVFIELTGISGEKRVNQITKQERRRVEELLKSMPLSVTGFTAMNSAIITSGGVHVGDINPKTMESKIVDGLYFAGEMIDVDALTGGYNIQIAASTGWLAGKE